MSNQPWDPDEAYDPPRISPQRPITTTPVPPTQPAMPPVPSKHFIEHCDCSTCRVQTRWVARTSTGHVYTSTPLDKVKEFHTASGVGPLDMDMLMLRRKLIREEYREVLDEIGWFFEGQGSKKNLAKELADLLYVAYGTAVVFGIDLDRVFDEVHRSNMSKLEGERAVRADGKIEKGPNYRPPNLSFVEEL